MTTPLNLSERLAALSFVIEVDGSVPLAILVKLEEAQTLAIDMGKLLVECNWALDKVLSTTAGCCNCWERSASGADLHRVDALQKELKQVEII